MEQFQSQRGADAVTLVYTCHGTICGNERQSEPATTDTLLVGSCCDGRPCSDAGPSVRGQDG